MAGAQVASDQVVGFQRHSWVGVSVRARRDLEEAAGRGPGREVAPRSRFRPSRFMTVADISKIRLTSSG